MTILMGTNLVSFKTFICFTAENFNIPSLNIIFHNRPVLEKDLLFEEKKSFLNYIAEHFQLQIGEPFYRL